MAWVRIDDNVPHHRKHLKAGPAASWLWVCCIAYAQRHLSDGFIPAEAVPMLGVGKGSERLMQALVQAGLIEVVDGGFVVHDYLDLNDTKEEALEKQQASHDAKVRAGRAGGTERAKRRKQTVEAHDQADVADGKQAATGLLKQNLADGKQAAKGLFKQTQAPSHPIPSHPDLPSSTAETEEPPTPPPLPPTLPPRPSTFGRIDLHRWQLEALMTTLGPHAVGFELDAWVLSLSRLADEQGLVLDRKTVWPWVQAQLKAECHRRGLPVATAGETFGRQSSRILTAIANLGD